MKLSLLKRIVREAADTAAKKKGDKITLSPKKTPVIIHPNLAERAKLNKEEEEDYDFVTPTYPDPRLKDSKKKSKKINKDKRS